MKKLISISLLGGLAILGFSGCSSMDINTRQDPQANLVNYKTYAWAPTEPANITDIEAERRREVLAKTLQQSVDAQLAAKGYKKTSPENADFLVAYSASTRDRINFRTAPQPARPGVDYYGPTFTENYREGQLTLDFLDSKTTAVIWEGVATEALGNSGATQDEIAEAVEKLFKNYPTA